MTRLLGLLLCITLVLIIGIALIGRAIDHELRYQDRVITTKHGRTLDCRIERHEDGSVYLNDCNYVQVP